MEEHSISVCYLINESWMTEIKISSANNSYAYIVEYRVTV